MKKLHIASVIANREIAGYDGFVVDTDTLIPYDPEIVLPELMDLDFGHFCYAQNKPLQSLSNRIHNAILNQDSLHRQGVYDHATRYQVGLAAVSKLWDKNKVIYFPNTDFMNALMRTENVRIPHHIIERAPFRQFYIDLSVAKQFRMTGCFVSINGDTYEGNDLYVVVFPVYKDTLGDKAHVGKDMLMECFRISYGTIVDFQDLSGDQTAVVEVSLPGLLAKLRRIRKKPEKVLQKMLIPCDENVSEFRKFILQFVLYLSSRDPDVQKKESKIGAGPLSKPATLQQWDVGVRYGKMVKMHDMLSEYEDKEMTDDADSKRTVQNARAPRPYIRCAHWRHYWCGPKGHQHLELRWIEPVIVNGSQKDIVATIRQITDRKTMTTGESLVLQYLEKKRKRFKKEYTVKKIKKRFDFCIPNKGSRMMIEFDGEQHFRPVEVWGGDKGLEERRKSDALKTRWCEENKVPLLRIRYDQKAYIGEMIDDLLSNPDKYITAHNTYIPDTEYYAV